MRRVCRVLQDAVHERNVVQRAHVLLGHIKSREEVGEVRGERAAEPGDADRVGRGARFEAIVVLGAAVESKSAGLAEKNPCVLVLINPDGLLL